MALFPETGVVGRDTSAGLGLEEVSGVLFQSLQCLQIIVISIVAMRRGVEGTINIPL
jgi:hypothetical protein